MQLTVFPVSSGKFAGMNQVVIQNPVINSPFDEPKRHFRFSDDGSFTDKSQTTPASSFAPTIRILSLWLGALSWASRKMNRSRQS
jgi:hypothetical protein